MSFPWKCMIFFYVSLSTPWKMLLRFSVKKQTKRSSWPITTAANAILSGPHNSNRAVECNFLRMSSFYTSTSVLFRGDYKLTNLSSYRVEKLNNVSPDWATSLVSDWSTLGQGNCEFSKKKIFPKFKINNSKRNCAWKLSKRLRNQQGLINYVLYLIVRFVWRKTLASTRHEHPFFSHSLQLVRVWVGSLSAVSRMYNAWTEYTSFKSHSLLSD